MHRQPGHEALRVSAVLWSCVVGLPGTWERQGSAGAELALCQQDTRWRCEVKAEGSHSLSLFFLFIYFYFIIFLLATPFLPRVLTRCFCTGI